MRIADSATMHLLDERCQTDYGIPGILLMEGAARALLKHLNLEKTYFVVVCGPGNNGGDGLALARLLKALGKEVDVFSLRPPLSYPREAGVYGEILVKAGISHQVLSPEESLWSFSEALKDADVLVDALWGTGLTRPLPDFVQKIIRLMNDFSPKIIAVDVPSGLQADTGKPLPEAVHAAKTVTFECLKTGFFQEEAQRYLGQVVVEPIGIPASLKEEVLPPYCVTEPEDLQRIIPLRDRSGYKNRYGHCLVVAGSPGYTGAALLCAEGAVAAGSGLVTLCAHEEALDLLVPRLTEVMSLYPENLEQGTKKADVIALGPGLGNSPATFNLLLQVLKTLLEEGKTGTTLVLDADGLNVLQGRTDLLKDMGCPVIITPHPGEMARLTGKTRAEIHDDRVGTARAFAREHGVIVVLKGHRTVITDGIRVQINPTGSSAMAQGGMGDALTGIIASFAGQGISPWDAAVAGVYLHGHIGDLLAKERYSVKPSEIIAALPKVMGQVVRRGDPVENSLGNMIR